MSGMYTQSEKNFRVSTNRIKRTREAQNPESGSHWRRCVHIGKWEPTHIPVNAVILAF